VLTADKSTNAAPSGHCRLVRSATATATASRNCSIAPRATPRSAASSCSDDDTNTRSR
jgi:hypothetical protein